VKSLQEQIKLVGHMKELRLIFVNLPQEFVTLMKSNLSGQVDPAIVFNAIRPNKALYSMLEKSFQHLDDGRGLEKTMLSQGWNNFRNRVASLYVSKAIYGHYPLKTDMALVEDLIEFEQEFQGHGVQSNSRIFLLGFYLKLAQLNLQETEGNRFFEIEISKPSVIKALKLTQGRSQRLDFLILTLSHFIQGLGEKTLTNAIVQGKSFSEIYDSMGDRSRKLMHDNLLAYGSSINEDDTFLYEKV
jgi:hypothetical protein